MTGGTFTSGTTALTATGPINLNGGTFTPSVAVTAQNNVTVGSAFTGTTATFTFSGTANQTYTNATGAPFTSGDVTVNKASGNLTLANHMSLNSVGQDLIVTTGTILMSGMNLIINGTLNLAAAGSIITLGGGTLSVGGANVGAGPYGSGTVN